MLRIIPATLPHHPPRRLPLARPPPSHPALRHRPLCYTRAMTPLASLALRILLVLSPLAAHRIALPGWAETPWERGVRYVAIANDVAAAVTEACGGKPG